MKTQQIRYTAAPTDSASFLWEAMASSRELRLQLCRRADRTGRGGGKTFLAT